MTSSGCRGGPDPVSWCHDHLGGAFCLLCNQSDHYYVDASDDSVAKCQPCGDMVSTLFRSVGVACVVVAFLGAVLFALHQWQRHHVERAILLTLH
eukprot:1632969-Prymnesium_polylepis.1